MQGQLSAILIINGLAISTCKCVFAEDPRTLAEIRRTSFYYHSVLVDIKLCCTPLKWIDNVASLQLFKEIYLFKYNVHAY